MADFIAAEAFRNEARSWLARNFPASLRSQSDRLTETLMKTGQRQGGDAELWRRRVGEKGWGAPTWPKVYGGGGLPAAEARVLAQEMDEIGAYNPIDSLGTRMFGATLLEFGDDEQKHRHIPPIVRGDVVWCQGYSEPCAGSDLAALQTRCTDAGGHFLVNGQKIWTSGAQYADWCFCLVRTDTSRKRDGISFALIDMHQKGVEVRPIKLISGDSPFCETFFTDARVEKNDVVGPINGGWTIGKRLLQHERSSQASGRVKSAATKPPDLAKSLIGLDHRGRIADVDLRSRIAAHMIDARAHTLTVKRAAAEAKGIQNPTANASIMKNSGTRVGQDRAELTLEILGCSGLGWDGEPFTEPELATVRAWLSGKATTILGGSFEIQNNIIAKRVLGLPDATHSV